MKRKIAVYANGWSDEIVSEALEGMMRYAREIGTDVFVFLTFASYGSGEQSNLGENSVLHVGDLADFDGLIILSNLLNSDEDTVRQYCAEAGEKGIPVISVGMDIDKAGYVKLDNSTSMRKLVLHLIKNCGVKRMAYAGGNEEHVDCKARLQVIKDVAAENGLRVRDEDIYFGDWSFQLGQEIGDSIMNSPDGLPDAVLCANDDTAIAVATRFQQRGYTLPDDLIVTGYDCTQAGQTFYPALTTVSQDYIEIGYRCCKWIYDTLEGKDVDRVIHATSHFVLGESSGSDPDVNARYDQIRKKIAKKTFLEDMQSILLDQRIESIEGGIYGSRDPDHLKGNLAWYYRKANDFEGESFYLVIEKDFFDTVYRKQQTFTSLDYYNEMLAMVARRNGQPLNVDLVNHRELIPGYLQEETAHLYCFSPLHVGAVPFGYTVLVDNIWLVKGKKISHYVNRLQHALERFRNNMYIDLVNRELMEISLRDSLTGLGNRFSVDQKAVPLFEECRTDGRQMLFMFIDINDMKLINDRYGHLQGDLALRIVANVIAESIPSEWIPIRYGGDEFLIVGQLSKGEDPEQIRQTVYSRLESTRQTMSIPYQLSVSCGYVLTDGRDNLSFSEYITIADNNMYEIKKQYHQNHSS
ncbi:MAG: diguanylate cyclase domain-containing protein [Acetatifactor sp.]